MSSSKDSCFLISPLRGAFASASFSRRFSMLVKISSTSSMSRYCTRSRQSFSLKVLFYGRFWETVFGAFHCFCNEVGGGGRELARVTCTLNSISLVANLKGITSNLTLTCLAVKSARHVFILSFFYVPRMDPLPPSYFSMFIFSRIELRLAHNIQDRERWLRNLWSYTFKI